MSANRPNNDRFADYIPVAERIERFYERYPEGRIVTHIIDHDREAGFILIRAEAYRTPDDAQPASTGHAFEVRGESYVNKTSYVENCETGACGRALALLGFEVKRGVASREEMQKTERMRPANVAPLRPEHEIEEEVPKCECGDPAKYWQSEDGMKRGYFCAKRKGDPDKCGFKMWLS